MADATQVKRRRGTASQCESMTPAEAEIIVDLTNDTTRVGDGVRAGGFIQPNFSQIQTQQFVYAVAGGTANAITVSLNPPLIGYVGGTSLEFRASNNNTGAATINVNGLGAKNIKKLSGGVLTDVASGDIVAGVVYRVTYDGTQFQVTNAEFTPPAPTGGLVKISTTSINATYPAATTISLPSGYTSFRIDIPSIYATSGNLVNFSLNTTSSIMYKAVSTSSLSPSIIFFEITLSSTGFVSEGKVSNGVSAESVIAGNTNIAVTTFNIYPFNLQTITGTATLYGRN